MDNRGQMADDSHMIPLAVSMFVGYAVPSVVFGPGTHSMLSAVVCGVVGVALYENHRSKNRKHPDRWKAEGGSSE